MTCDLIFKVGEAEVCKTELIDLELSLIQGEVKRRIQQNVMCKPKVLGPVDKKLLNGVMGKPDKFVLLIEHDKIAAGKS